MLGVTLALVAGKPLGVISVSWLMVRSGWSRLPEGVTWRGIGLIGLLTGVGFTMSIFIAMLAFADENLLGAAKLGVLLGSFVAARAGSGLGIPVHAALAALHPGAVAAGSPGIPAAGRPAASRARRSAGPRPWMRRPALASARICTACSVVSVTCRLFTL